MAYEVMSSNNVLLRKVLLTHINHRRIRMGTNVTLITNFFTTGITVVAPVLAWLFTAIIIILMAFVTAVVFAGAAGCMFAALGGDPDTKDSPADKAVGATFCLTFLGTIVLILIG